MEPLDENGKFDDQEQLITTSKSRISFKDSLLLMTIEP